MSSNWLPGRGCEREKERIHSQLAPSWAPRQIDPLDRYLKCPSAHAPDAWLPNLPLGA